MTLDTTPTTEKRIITDLSNDELYRELVRADVLKDFSEALSQFNKPAVAWICGDHRYYDTKYEFLAAAARRMKASEIAGIFPVSCAGGMLAVLPDSPLHGIADHRPMAKFNLDLTYRKGLTLHVIFGHFGSDEHLACAAADLCELTFYRYIKQNVQTKDYLKNGELKDRDYDVLLLQFYMTTEGLIFINKLSRIRWKQWRRDMATGNGLYLLPPEELADVEAEDKLLTPEEKQKLEELEKEDERMPDGRERICCVHG